MNGDEFLYQVIRHDMHLCGCGEGQSDQAAFLISRYADEEELADMLDGDADG